MKLWWHRILKSPRRRQGDAVESSDPKAMLAMAAQAIENRRFQTAIGFLHLLLRQNGDSIDALRLRASAYASLGMNQHAIEDYERVVIQPGSVTDDLLALGIAYYHLKDGENAQRTFSQAILKDQNNVSLFLWRGGTFLFLMQDEVRAEEDFEFASKLDPLNPSVHLNRARLYASREQWEQCVAELRHCVSHETFKTDSLQLRAESLTELGQIEQAIDDLSSILCDDPSNVSCLESRAELWRQIKQFENETADEALANAIPKHQPGSYELMTMKQRNLFDSIKKHFMPNRTDELSIMDRTFPIRVRADLQHAIDEVVGAGKLQYFSGIRKEYEHGGIQFSDVLADSSHSCAYGVPPQYEEVDVGDLEAVRCLTKAIWMIEFDGTPCAILLTCENGRYGGETGVRIQFAAIDGQEGHRVSSIFFRNLERAVNESKCYRGKILSFENTSEYRGHAVGITVHKLKSVNRDQVILPLRTLELLDRNVIEFTKQRPRLRELGLSTKKGLLFYGPPGTGKTHTIHYLAKALEGHTTLIIAAEQVANLGEYMTLARLLQPSIVVLEDVDLIARDREEMDNPCAESLLNKLLNEMDGLKGDADILFLLTTNRPEALEQALASRPGRVDQAIEFPLPDEIGRRKLLNLYAPSLTISEELLTNMVARTEGTSAAFLKELMRRITQFHLAAGEEQHVSRNSIDNALDEMLFQGGQLNRSILGTSARDT